MSSNTSTLTQLKVGAVVETYGCTFDSHGHYSKEYEIVSLNSSSISLKHLRTRRYSGVTEESGTVEVHDRDMIDHLLIPANKRWEKSYRDDLAIARGLNHGGKAADLFQATANLPVPNPP